MQSDIRAGAAQYYDTNPAIPDDIAFYQARLPWSDASVLGGNGTGRVLPTGGIVWLYPWYRSLPGHARALPPEVAGCNDTAEQSAGGA